MIVYKDTAYGQDIDGNRGTTIYEIELEDSDKPYILEELYKYFVDEYIRFYRELYKDYFEKLIIIS